MEVNKNDKKMNIVKKHIFFMIITFLIDFPTNNVNFSLISTLLKDNHEKQQNLKFKTFFEKILSFNVKIAYVAKPFCFLIVILVEFKYTTI